MLATFAEAKDSTLTDIASACPNGQTFRRLLNEAVQRLLNRGDWEGTVVPMQVCTYGGCVVFPRWVGQVRKLNVCNHTRLTPKNNWYDFIPYDSNWRSAWCGPQMGMVQYGRSPVFQDVLGEGRLIRAYARCNADMGKTMTIFGTDNNGQALTQLDDLGNFIEGKTLTFTKPFVSTDTYVRKIDRILKDKTQCPVNVYGYNVAEDVLEDIAQYDPGDTNPAFVKYQLRIGCCTNIRSVVALVKLQYVPVESDTDLVLVDNLPALKDFMQSIKYRAAGDTQSANAFEASAVRELNLSLWNRDQEDSVSVAIEPFGPTPIGYQHCF